MTAPALELTEDRVPFANIDESVRELVELYGGEITASRERSHEFTLPLRRGVASSGAVECTLSWAPDDEREATLRLACNRDVDAPKVQRVLFLLAGVVGAVLFMLWPFFPGQREFGTLAWLGGLVALAVYFMSLRRTSGGIAYDFLQRLAARQRAVDEEERVR
ncbi:MAG TPA: hypothetical protein VF824_23025 [Thermoanaerobaculia bacterium]|jgi:hypothetical protein